MATEVRNMISNEKTFVASSSKATRTSNGRAAVSGAEESASPTLSSSTSSLESNANAQTTPATITNGKETNSLNVSDEAQLVDSIEQEKLESMLNGVQEVQQEQQEEDKEESTRLE